MKPSGAVPWRVDVENYAGTVLVDVLDAANDCVAEVKDVAIAEYIVRACNAHTEMLSALRLVAMATVPICAEGHGPRCDCVGDLVRAAIQWAER